MLMACSLIGLALEWRSLRLKDMRHRLLDLTDKAPGVDSLGCSQEREAWREGSGLFGKNGQESWRMKFLFVWLLPLTAGAACWKTVFEKDRIFLLVLLSAIVGYLVEQGRARRKVQQQLELIEFHLPLVMERLVMAVQAGLDIIPALQVLVGIPSESGVTDGCCRRENTQLDPVSQLLQRVLRLSESGLSFEESLRQVAGGVGCRALQHAFIHLALAQRQGGELVGPLSELSDATQAHYQDRIEECIAQLPVKATWPLLCTFAGLVVCFITIPLIQVLKLLPAGNP